MPKSTDACNRFVNLLYRATAWPQRLAWLP